MLYGSGSTRDGRHLGAVTGVLFGEQHELDADHGGQIPDLRRAEDADGQVFTLRAGIYQRRQPHYGGVARRLAASPQPVNTGVTLSAPQQAEQPDVSSGALLCRHRRRSQVQAFSTANTASWTPSAAGLYLLTSTAQDGAAAASR